MVVFYLLGTPLTLHHACFDSSYWENRESCAVNCLEAWPWQQLWSLPVLILYYSLPNPFVSQKIAGCKQVPYFVLGDFFFHFYVFIWLCCVLVMACGVDYPTSCEVLVLRTQDQTCIPCNGRWIFNHWTTREVPLILFLNVSFLLCKRVLVIVHLSIQLLGGFSEIIPIMDVWCHQYHLSGGSGVSKVHVHRFKLASPRCLPLKNWAVWLMKRALAPWEHLGEMLLGTRFKCPQKHTRERITYYFQKRCSLFPSWEAEIGPTSTCKSFAICPSPIFYDGKEPLII